MLPRGHRCGPDPVLLWLWCRWAAAATIGPLAWELSYDAGAALERKKKKMLGAQWGRGEGGSAVGCPRPGPLPPPPPPARGAAALPASLASSFRNWVLGE